MKIQKIISVLSVLSILALSACSVSAQENGKAVWKTKSDGNAVPAFFADRTFDASFEQYSISVDEGLSGEDIDSLIFGSAYITYDKPGAENVNSSVKIRPGDVLDNGLTVETASTSVRFPYADAGSLPDKEYYVVSYIQAKFSGTLTLTGTLTCYQEDNPIYIEGSVKGSLHFIPDGSNQINLPRSLSEEVDYYLGNVDDEGLPDGITEAVNADGKETARVRVTLKDITVQDTKYSSSGSPDKATLVKLEFID